MTYANGYNHQVKRINRGFRDLFLLFQLQRIYIGEGLGLGKIGNNDKRIKHFQIPHLERHITRQGKGFERNNESFLIRLHLVT